MESVVQLSLTKFSDYLKANSIKIIAIYCKYGTFKDLYVYLMRVEIQKLEEKDITFEHQTIIEQHPQFFILIDQQYNMPINDSIIVENPSIQFLLMEPYEDKQKYVYYLNTFNLSLIPDTISICLLSSNLITFENETFELSTQVKKTIDKENFSSPTEKNINELESKMKTVINKFSIQNSSENIKEVSESDYSEIDEPMLLEFKDANKKTIIENSVYENIIHQDTNIQHNSINNDILKKPENYKDYELKYEYGDIFIIQKISNFFDYIVVDNKVNFSTIINLTLKYYTQVVKVDRSNRKTLTDFIIAANLELNDKYVSFLNDILNEEVKLDKDEEKIIKIITDMQDFKHKMSIENIRKDIDNESENIISEAKTQLYNIKERRLELRNTFLKFFETRKKWYQDLITSYTL